MTDGPHLLVEIQDSIALVSFNRPARRNALTFAMYKDLADLCQDPPQGCKAMVIRGAGDAAFAAGTDISQFKKFSTAEDFLAYEQQIDDVLDAIETARVPTIAAISGACTGGGAMIATACDLRISEPGLKFGVPIARTLGNCLSARSLARLTSLIGAARVREIIFTSRLVAAKEAKEIGFVSEICDHPNHLFARATELASNLAEQAPLTLRATKILQHRMLANQIDDADLVLQCYQSEDFRNGLEAFLNKKKPEWQGK